MNLIELLKRSAIECSNCQLNMSKCILMASVTNSIADYMHKNISCHYISQYGLIFKCLVL